MSATHPYRGESDREASRKVANEFEKKATEILKVGLPAATVVIAGVAGTVQGAALAILVLAGGALVGVIAILWASVRTLVGETPLSGADAYALGAPRAEEEQKRSVLRALKDLEFERSVGKISDEDYHELVAKYRAEAKRLLRILDAEAQPRREHIEALVNKRLRREGFTVSDREPSNDKDPQAPAAEVGTAVAFDSPVAAKAKKRVKARVAMDPVVTDGAADRPDQEDSTPDRKCGSCGTMNDADAVFCKKCGAKRAAADDEASKAPVDEASKAPVETALPSEKEDVS